MVSTNIGSILLGSNQVEAVKTWYRRAFGWEENDMGAFQVGAVQLFIEPHSEVSGPTKEPARSIINLDVAGCPELESHLKNMGVKWIREVEQMPFGLIGTVADPDGNYVQIIEWGAAPESHRS
jgi:predicted enzyme related to lactoylglutathione lyase